VIWKSKEPYDPLKLNELAFSLPFNEIDTIVIEKKGHFWSGLGGGFLVGGGIGTIIGWASAEDDDDWIDSKAMALIGGVTLGVCGASIGGLIGAVQGIDDHFMISGNGERYKAVLPILKRNAIFPSDPTGELPAFQQKRAEGLPPPFVKPFKEVPKPSPEPSKRRFHVSIGEGLVSTRANNDIIHAFKSSGFGGRKEGWFWGPTDYPDDNTIPISWNINAEYRLADHLRLGFALSKIPKQKIAGIDKEYEYAHGTSYSLLVEYVPVPVTRLLTSRWEFAMGVGPAYNSLSADGTLSSSFGATIVHVPVVSFVTKKNTIGMHLRGSLDYYLWKSFSLQLKAEGKLIPSIDVPAISHTNPNNNEVKTLRQHDVDFSSIDFSLGLRFHF
jgi:hypothetical protein